MKYKIRKILNIVASFIVYATLLVYTKIFHIKNDDVWLISERGTDARDNGYHFYKYLKTKHPEINVKYVIDDNSPDLDKIATNDRIKYRSLRHYILFLTAGKLISTHIMGYSPEFSLFTRLDKHDFTRTHGKRIFLQHGITKDYIETMTSKTSKLDLFCCGAKPEYNYILKNFGYNKKIIKYIGFARFDRLVNRPQKQILVMPTWRKYLKYTENFEKSTFFRTWNAFLSNPTLHKLLQDENIKLYFYPHYEMQKYLPSFKTKSKNIILANAEKYDVQKLLVESKILITDYSSVSFDFAYMGKPVIYYQFDYDKYRASHYSEGYYDYEKDGFGPVVTDGTDLLNAIKSALHSNLQNKVAKKIAKFFPIRDQNNCKRIFAAIEVIE